MIGSGFTLFVSGWAMCNSQTILAVAKIGIKSNQVNDAKRTLPTTIFIFKGIKNIAEITYCKRLNVKKSLNSVKIGIFIKILVTFVAYRRKRIIKNNEEK